MFKMERKSSAMFKTERKSPAMFKTERKSSAVLVWNGGVQSQTNKSIRHSNENRGRKDPELMLTEQVCTPRPAETTGILVKWKKKSKEIGNTNRSYIC